MELALQGSVKNRKFHIELTKIVKLARNRKFCKIRKPLLADGLA